MRIGIEMKNPIVEVTLDTVQTLMKSKALQTEINQLKLSNKTWHDDIFIATFIIIV